MAFRGQRFHVNLSDDEDETSLPNPRGDFAEGALPFNFVSDIKERPTTAAKPPSVPKFKSTTTGFPEHKKRTKISAFKQQRVPNENGNPATSAVSTAATTSQTPFHTNASSLTQGDISFNETERRKIDEENRQRLEAMSEAEIEQERQELFSALDPSLIERLLKRANIDEGRGDTGLYPEDDFKLQDIKENQGEIHSPPAEETDGAPVPIPQPTGKKIKASKTVSFVDDDVEPLEPIGVHPASETDPSLPPLPTIHFPTSHSTPDLDPSDPDFLANLHTKYFPSLPADPSKLAWMAPIPTPQSPADLSSPYSPQQTALPPSALRFNFRGALLPPRIARAIPVTKGLHHHGEAPEAAGYTIPELARLARSAFPAQRCLAFQMLGRVLYRLGRGEWSGSGGDGDGKEVGDLEKGLWKCLEEGRVIEGLEEAGNTEGGHLGSKAYALEALWLYQKGGGKVWRNA